MPTLASNNTCTACMACMNACPKQAISCFALSDGHRMIKVDPEKCIECKLCEKVCPIVNDFSYGRQNLKSNFYAAWANDYQIRHKGATSGIFGALANAIISEGGLVCSAVMNGLECEYILTSDPDDITKMQGSKYTSSNPGLIYKDIFLALKNNRKVFFCGLPCHVAGLINFIPDSLKENLTTADLICGGVSSPLLIKRFAEENLEVNAIESFRSKDNGWKPSGFRYNLKYRNEEDKIISTADKGRNLVTDGFACELTDRKSCYDCKFAYSNRKSDLTLGDLWGDKDFRDQHSEGVSAIIVHTSNGEKILDKADISLHKINPEKVLLHNDKIFNGKNIKGYLPERIMLGKLLPKLSYSSLMKVYASDFKVSDLLWLPFAAYRYFSFKAAEFVKQCRSKALYSKIENNKI